MVDAGGLRIVYFGTPAFAVPTLEALCRSRHTVVAVVTQPDRARGRGQRTSDAPVKAAAGTANLPILQPESLRDPAFVDALRQFDADLGVVAAYGKILTEQTLAVPRLGIVNVHASLLPRYRGAAPVHRAVIAGERETGITIMRVVRALDAGPMMATAARPIGPDETSDEVERDLARIGAGLAVETIDRLAAGVVSEVPQVEAEATYAHRLSKDDGRVNWALPARRVHDLIRGLHPWPHAFTFLDGKRLILLRSAAFDEVTETVPGTVVEAAGDRLRIATGGGAVQILEIQTEGRRPMTAREFLAGHTVATGAILQSR
jgi:methionyl-tRNA formyltransferase